MKTVTLRTAQPADAPLLLEWMGEFNALEGLVFDRARAAPALAQLLDARPSRVFVLGADHELAGYAVFAWGPAACLTELFLRAELRRRGLAVRVMEVLEAEARRHDARALRLLVGHAARGPDARHGVQPKRLEAA